MGYRGPENIEKMRLSVLRARWGKPFLEVVEKGSYALPVLFSPRTWPSSSAEVVSAAR